jgi:hypothetical protein
MRPLLFGLLLLTSGFALGQAERPARGGPGRYGFLLPGPILQRLDLSADQKNKLFTTLEKFVDKHKETLDELRQEHTKARQAMEQARRDRDRVAGKKAQQRLAELNSRVNKLREQLEPDVLAVLTEAQKKKYREWKKAGGAPPLAPAMDPAALAKLKPLTELGTGEYKGYKGGLYPGGKNERPAKHDKAGRALAATVRPLGADGKPATGGKIVLLSVGMSNTSQEFTAFIRLADTDEKKNPHVVIVNGAQGGMSANRILDPEDEGSGTRYWSTVDDRLKEAGASRAQVQVVWLKQADPGPRQGFPAYARTLQGELTKIVQLLPKRFPNVKLVYLSSRTYGGYARTPLNPEPYAYESGLSVKWLIERQLEGDAALNYDPDKGKVAAPWLSWGPYLWANGTAKRSDGFSYEEKDFANDGTHPSASGQRKVAGLLLKFFQTDATAQPWFVKGAD